MVLLTTFIRSFLVGFVICMPIGPVALSLIKKTLHKNKRAGFIAGIGSASADAIFSIIVALGLTFVSNFLMQHQITLQTIAALFIATLGARTLQAASQQHHEPIATTYAGDFFETFLLAIANPVTMFAIGGFLATLGICVNNGCASQGLAIIAGIFCGEMLWWISAVLLFDYVGKHATARALIYINKIAGYTLLILSAAIFIRVLYWS